MPMTENTAVRMIAGTTIGILIDSAIRSCDAPSSFGPGSTSVAPTIQGTQISSTEKSKASDGVPLDLLPVTFRVDWACRVGPDGAVVRTTDAAPSGLGWIDLDRTTRLDPATGAALG